MPDKDYDALLEAMTLEEQVSLLSGASFWRTAAIERLGVAPVKLTDGPNGARGEDFSGGIRSAAYPVGIALAATWAPSLVEEAAADLAREARSKGARVLLGPTVNMHRNPLNGRNFECFSEDPTLASAMAVAYVRGVQSQGVGATIKHFIGNECEHERRTTSSQIDETTLREIYLPPFEAAVKEARVACVMTAYNALNGVHTSQNHWLLEDVLRGEWGFDGVVMSDWTATHSTAEGLLAGLDLEMPGPTVHRGAKLIAAARDDAALAGAVRRSARRILALADRVGAGEQDDLDTERAEDRPETRALIRRLGAEAAVLLKNDDRQLPLDPARLSRVAVIGPNSAKAVMFGGGSAQINAHYSVSPLQGLRQALPGVEITHAIGCPGDRYLPLLDQPVEIRFFEGVTMQGDPVLVKQGETSEFRWFGPVAPEVDHLAFSARLATTYEAPETGAYEIGLMSAGTSRLYVDGVLVLDAWNGWSRGQSYFGHGSDERRTVLHMQAGRRYEITLDYACGDGLTTTLKAVRFGLRPPSAKGSLEEAVALAKEADAVIVVAGLNDSWETEAEDRASLALPEPQDALIEAVLAANPATTVVIQSGSPVQMPWADRARSILQLWYPGQECGHALADVLTGRAEPGGRLPQSFPAGPEGLEGVMQRPDRGASVPYDEGSFIGYRGFLRRGDRPAFPFGHGLGYADIRFGESRVSATPEGASVEVVLQNHSDRPGQEVVQIYLRGAEDNACWLRAFRKLRLQPGERGEVRLDLTRRDFSRWSEEDGEWREMVGPVEILIGRSVEVIHNTHMVDLAGSKHCFAMSQTAGSETLR
ncbi:Thermostable beta-glucosidase B [Pseudooceanicola marinus]|uniref:Thermostable beta-glucosidase B n=1 Tax=Pseudooceanicola marinus TaxID=396013 RepID=A0A1X6YFF7_9RHOB|nr:glycoside hydrolase family 3 C-terminal domain-containing protein [Pseudooceanicola marinus]PJE27354.1 beta-glucosidase [Pseudooceanicola marinus]SLN19161.1 Thermostable beta-glucosidase B [Pseudooceanicola marinus]